MPKDKYECPIKVLLQAGLTQRSISCSFTIPLQFQRDGTQASIGSKHHHKTLISLKLPAYTALLPHMQAIRAVGGNFEGAHSISHNRSIWQLIEGFG